MSDPNKPNIVELTADVVSAYVGNNAVAPGNLTALISEVHKALSQTLDENAQAEQEKLKPAVPIRRSVQPDYIVCLEDGKKFKALKRHLRNSFDMSPEEYRAKWGLPADYPMVAPNYAKVRSELAKKIGLGQKR